MGAVCWRCGIFLVATKVVVSLKGTFIIHRSNLHKLHKTRSMQLKGAQIQGPPRMAACDHMGACYGTSLEELGGWLLISAVNVLRKIAFT
jgi:hypothetical protein